MQGKACNVAKSGDVGSLANYARDTLGTVDLWQAPPHALQLANGTLATLPQASSSERVAMLQGCTPQLGHASTHVSFHGAGCCLTQSSWRRINNAGSNAYKYKTLSESTDADLIRIVETNVLGTMLGCKEVS